MPACRPELENVQVLINSYGREARFIERAAFSAIRQDRPPAAVHFVDQNAEPLVLSPELLAAPRFRHHHRPGPSCALARNLALELAPSGWIAFADDDSHWAPDYSERLSELLEREPGLGLIAGAIRDETTGDYYSLRQRVGGTLERFSGSKLLAGANFLVRAEVFAVVGGYDPRFGPGAPWPSGEETDLCWRILATGVPARYDPSLAVFHPPMHVASVRAAARKACRYGHGKGSLAAVWLLEKHHRFGLLEFLEMTFVPFVKAAHGLGRGEFSELLIQPATLWGRHRAFWDFALRRALRRR